MAEITKSRLRYGQMRSVHLRRAGRFALRYWVALILVALAAIFIAQNRDRPRVHILCRHISGVVRRASLCVFNKTASMPNQWH